MRKVWVKYIASTSLVLNVLLVISIIIVILHDFVFVNLRELFEGGVELWNLAYKLSFDRKLHFLFRSSSLEKTARSRESLTVPSTADQSHHRRC